MQLSVTLSYNTLLEQIIKQSNPYVISGGEASHFCRSFPSLNWLHGAPKQHCKCLRRSLRQNSSQLLPKRDHSYRFPIPSPLQWWPPPESGRLFSGAAKHVVRVFGGYGCFTSFLGVSSSLSVSEASPLMIVGLFILLLCTIWRNGGLEHCVKLSKTADKQRLCDLARRIWLVVRMLCDVIGGFCGLHVCCDLFGNLA